MKKILVPLLSILLLFSSVSVSALTVSEYAETVDIYDVYNNPQYVGDDYEVGFRVKPFDVRSLNAYDKGAEMNVTYMGWKSYYNSSMNGSSNLVFGSYIARNPDNSLVLTISNSNNPLFDVSGTLGLEIVVRGNNVRIMANHSSSDSITYTVGNCSTTEIVKYIEIDNSLGDLYEIVLYIDNITSGYEEGKRVYGCFNDYGYFPIDAEDNESGWAMISNFFKDFFENTLNTFRNALASFFGDVSNSGSVVDSVDNVTDLENEFINGVNSNAEFTLFDDTISSPSLIVTFTWIGTILTGLFYNISFSVIFRISATLLCASILLGFARHWNGKGD